MNKLTQDIATWLGVSTETAYKVQNEMAIYWGADFSEDSTEQLIATAKLAYTELKLEGV